MRSRYSLRMLCLLFVLASVAAGLLGGCGIALHPTPTPEPITLRYAAADAQNPRYPQLVEEFRGQYPHITIEVTPSFDTADVVMAPILGLGDIIANRNVIALDPYLEGDARFASDAFLPGTVEMLRDDGRLWGLPAGVDPLVLFYNQDLFDAASAPYPPGEWNWNDFLDKAGAVSDPAANIYGYVPTGDATDVVAFIYQHGGGFMDSLTNPTRPTFSDPRNAEALEWYLSLANTYGVMPPLEELSGANTPQALVYANKVGMWSAWFSDRGGHEAQSNTAWPAPWPFRWGATALPSDAASTTLAQVGAYFISAQCKTPDAAWAWIAFLSERVVHDAAPARVAVLESRDYEKLVGEEMAEMARGVLADAQMLSPRVMRYAGAFEVLGRELERVVSGEQSAQDAMDHVQAVAEQQQ